MKQNRRSWLSKITLAIAGIGFLKLPVHASIPKEKTIQRRSNSFSPDDAIKLGAFSISLNVKNLEASKQFYENIGFSIFGGDMKSNYLIMKNGNALVGIFQGMFEKTMLTFNPGWDENAQVVSDYQDVREIQKKLKEKGLPLTVEADEKTSGPGYIMLSDPDGNPILIDQHL